MQMRFPRNEDAWMRQVEQLLMQLAVDRDRLMKTSPQIPDPEAGTAFTGPLDPTLFNFRNDGDQSGTSISGTGPLSGGSAT